MPEFILTVTLNPAVDKTLRIDRFQIGQDHRFKEAFYSAGGKGINVSRALQRLHVSSLATGFIGGLAGEYIKTTLRQEGIPHEFVMTSAETRTSLTIIATRDDTTTRILEPGPTVRPTDKKNFLAMFRRLLTTCDIVVLSGRSVPGVGDEFYAQLVAMAQQVGRKAVLDTSGRPLAAALKNRPFLIKPNLAEAEYVLKRKLSSKNKLKEAVTAFCGMGVTNVIISLADRGVVASNGDGCWSVQPPDISVVNTVGCGDALVAGFLYAWRRGWGFPKALRLAVATGTANSLHMQPGHFTRPKIDELAKACRIEQF